MSTDSRRARARKRRGRGFLLAFAAVLGALILVGVVVGGVVSVAQGPRVTDVQVDPAAAVAASGARVILTTTQSLEKIDVSQVRIASRRRRSPWTRPAGASASASPSRCATTPTTPSP